MTRFIFGVWALLLISTNQALAQSPNALTGLWINEDNRLATIQKTIYRQHCENGRLIWFVRLQTSSIIEWEIYSGRWQTEGANLTHEVTLFERAQSPSFGIVRRTNLTSSFGFLVSRIGTDSFDFERQYGFPPRDGTAQRLDEVPLPRPLRGKASCEQSTS